jgi:hypothetical protein
VRYRQRGYSFPGDHADKQAARLYLYRHALTAPIQGHAVALAGTEPESEVSLMRDYLKWPAHRTWFVDNSKRPEVIDALHRVHKNWPDANVQRVNLWNLVPKLGAIGFANLDFMGAPLQEETLECTKEVVKRLLPQGILGFTWMRGREYVEGTPSAQLLYKLGKGYKGDERRWAGVLRAFDMMSDGALDFIGKYEYLSKHSPMSVAVFRRVPLPSESSSRARQ